MTTNETDTNTNNISPDNIRKIAGQLADIFTGNQPHEFFTALEVLMTSMVEMFPDIKHDIVKAFKIITHYIEEAGNNDNSTLL